MTEVASTICERLADGESLRGICADPRMPDKATVHRWLARHNEFRDQYSWAREAQADALADEILEIADDARGDWVEKIGTDGKPVLVMDHENIERSRLRIKARKWQAARMAPRKYGVRTP